MTRSSSWVVAVLCAVALLGSPAQSQENTSLIDQEGNIYTVGTFSGTVDFDPGPTVFKLTAAGESDIFVSKVDDNGRFRWARRLGGARNDSFARAVLKNARIYLQGYSQAQSDFDEILLAKLDVRGDIAWVKKFAGRYDAEFFGPARAASFAVDLWGNVYTGGQLTSATDFDPGPNTFYLAQCCDTSVMFLSKLDAAGRFVWAQAIQSGDAFNSLVQIAPDLAGNLYAIGRFQNAVFGESSLNAVDLPDCDFPRCDSYDVFISKLSRTGEFLWTGGIGGALNDEPLGLEVGSRGHAYVTGVFFGVVDFDPGPGVFSRNAGDGATFLVRLDPAGAFVWARRL